MEVASLAISGLGANCLRWLHPMCGHPLLLDHSPGKPPVVFDE